MSDVIKFDTVNAVKNEGYIKLETFFLVDESDPILKQKTEDFDFENPAIDPNEFASSLVETCREHNGFGLAANQCGFSHRVFVMGSGDQYISCFNPKILESSADNSLMVEGCLSFPALALNVSRPQKILVEYQDFVGEKHTATFEGLTAHIFQHELDHLNGICYTDRAKPMALKMGMKKRGKFNKLLNRYNLAKKVLDTVGK